VSTEFLDSNTMSLTQARVQYASGIGLILSAPVLTMTMLAVSLEAFCVSSVIAIGLVVLGMLISLKGSQNILMAHLKGGSSQKRNRSGVNP
jgi:hypothetical protein